MSALGYALVFILCFIIGGIIGTFTLPDFWGRFYISGLVFAVFATGAGALIISITKKF